MHMATMSVAGYLIMKGCTPNQIKSAKLRLVNGANGSYPVMIVENANGDIFLPASKKYGFTTVDELNKFITDHGGSDLRVAYGFDTATHKDCANLCLKGDDNSITIDLTTF